MVYHGEGGVEQAIELAHGARELEEDSSVDRAEKDEARRCAAREFCKGYRQNLQGCVSAAEIHLPGRLTSAARRPPFGVREMCAAHQANRRPHRGNPRAQSLRGSEQARVTMPQIPPCENGDERDGTLRDLPGPLEVSMA